MRKVRDRLLDLPGPWWTISACKPFSPVSLLETVLMELFPVTFGFHSHNVSHYRDTWVSRWHDWSVDRYWQRKYPEDYE
ncbi:hypothetical protein PBI_NEBKISS_95 [Mycobacterium phage Nebkiss]|nr:hypothetical protein PBI_NEBKISS_95 [Mycobacterium phage Nebkiss]